MTRTDLPVRPKKRAASASSGDELYRSPPPKKPKPDISLRIHAGMPKSGTISSSSSSQSHGQTPSPRVYAVDSSHADEESNASPRSAPSIEVAGRDVVITVSDAAEATGLLEDAEMSLDEDEENVADDEDSNDVDSSDEESSDEEDEFTKSYRGVN